MSGLGVYVRELLAAMGRIEAPVRWTLIGPADVAEELPPGLDVGHFIAFEAPIYSFSAALGYPRLAGADVWHYPHYNLPLARARGTVVNVFDLFHRRYGGFARRRYQDLFLRRIQWSRARVVTAAEKVRREVMERGLRGERVVTIPPGPGRTAVAGRPAPPPVVSLGGTPLRPPWLLVSGIDQRHKNFDFMLSALSLYYQRRPDAPPLVWTGLSEEGRRKRMRSLPAPLRQRVALELWTGAEQADGLMAGAAALLFPSLDEGFGFPPLEAMTRGVPVLSSRREPMTTILGDAPLYFEPEDSASLWRALDRLLDSPTIRQEVVWRGARQAALYDWNRTATMMVEIYRQAARGRGR